jgi:hypothetical protein
MFTRDFLAGVRRKALRRKVWYSALDSVERGILSLTSRIVDRVESRVLGVELVKILAKLRDALKSELVRRMEEYGYDRAKELAGIAVEWGNRAAIDWASEINLVRYLSVMDMNQPSGYGFPIR